MIAVPYDVPDWGTGVLGYVEGRLVHHNEPALHRTPVARGEAPSAAKDLARRLCEVLRGGADDFADVDCAPAVAWAGLTSFEQKVLGAARAIPRGETASYAEIAVLVGRPGAARAVGTACSRGVLPVIVPYHRVIRSDGGIGEYGDGEPGRKARLLALEVPRAR